MPKLIVNPTSASRREIKLSRTLLSIGRDPSNDLVLPDAMVSRRHAVIECRGNQYYLRDCNSSNGSVVNGDRISERSLRDGDLVAIGTARLLFREEVELEDAGGKVVQHPSAPRFLCPSCKHEYRKGDLFCRECGAGLQAPAGPPKAVCAACGTAVVLPARFCNACGAKLPVIENAEASTPELPQPAPVVTQAPEAPGAESAPEQAPAPPPAGVGTAPGADPRDLLAAPSPPAVSRFEGKPSPEPDRPGPRPGPRLAAALPEPRRVAPAERPWRARPAASRPEAVSGPSAPAPAGFGPRLLAGLADGLLVGLIQLVIVGPLAYLWALRGGADRSVVLPVLVPAVLGVAGFLIGLAYHVGFWATRGATPGKGWLGLRVVSTDGQPLGLGMAIARGLGYALSSATFGIGFLLIAKDGVGLHDRIAGTRVVARPTGE